MGGEGQSGGRRRLDVEERRAAILAAATRLYAERPYADVTVTDVAAAAGASQALVFHYFGSKGGLYAAVVEAAIAELRSRQAAADALLSSGVPPRDRVRTALVTYLDHVAEHPDAWAHPLRGGAEPAAVQGVRRAARADYAETLRGLLGVTGWARHEYAVWGYFGFLDAACLRWVERGCDPAEREPLIESALGALEGALGDWRV